MNDLEQPPPRSGELVERLTGQRTRRTARRGRYLLVGFLGLGMGAGLLVCLLTSMPSGGNVPAWGNGIAAGLGVWFWAGFVPGYAARYLVRRQIERAPNLVRYGTMHSGCIATDQRGRGHATGGLSWVHNGVECSAQLDRVGRLERPLPEDIAVLTLSRSPWVGAVLGANDFHLGRLTRGFEAAASARPSEVDHRDSSRTDDLVLDELLQPVPRSDEIVDRLTGNLTRRTERLARGVLLGLVGVGVLGGTIVCIVAGTTPSGTAPPSWTIGIEYALLGAFWAGIVPGCAARYLIRRDIKLAPDLVRFGAARAAPFGSYHLDLYNGTIVRLHWIEDGIELVAQFDVGKLEHALPSAAITLVTSPQSLWVGAILGANGFFIGRRTRGRKLRHARSPATATAIVHDEKAARAVRSRRA